MSKRRRRSRHRFTNVPNVPFCPDEVLNHRNSRNWSSGGEEARSAPSETPLYTSAGRSYETYRELTPQVRAIPPSLPNTSGNGSIYTPREFDDPGGHLGDVIPEPPAIVNTAIVERRNPITNWKILWALLRTCGTKRFTREQYQSVRLFSDALVRNGVADWKYNSTGDEEGPALASTASYLPHYSTLYKSVKPVLFRSLTVRSYTHQANVDLQKAGARSSGTSLSGDPNISIRTVLPSEYARADVATPLFFESIRSTSLESFEANGLSSKLPRISSVDCIDLIPLVAAREWFYGPPKSVAVDGCAESVPPSCTAEAGDVISVVLLPDDAIQVLEESVQRCFVSSPSSSPRRKIMGKVTDIWIVNHGKRALNECNAPCDMDGNARGNNADYNAQIRGIFDYVNYASPSDSVTVEVPALPDWDLEHENEEEDEVSVRRKAAELKQIKRLRKRAMDERRRQTDLAWRNWEKPVLKPGDTVALLRPCATTVEDRHFRQSDGALLTRNDLRSRLLLVNRYWTEQEERCTHILWIPGGCDFNYELIGRQKSVHDLHPYYRPLFNNSPRMYAHVREVFLVEPHAGPRGPQQFNPVSSLGRLDSGELYCVYRFVLFWDGFEVQDGKEASGDGV